MLVKQHVPLSRSRLPNNACGHNVLKCLTAQLVSDEKNQVRDGDAEKCRHLCGRMRNQG